MYLGYVTKASGNIYVTCFLCFSVIHGQPMCYNTDFLFETDFMTLHNSSEKLLLYGWKNTRKHMFRVYYYTCKKKLKLLSIA